MNHATFQIKLAPHSIRTIERSMIVKIDAKDDVLVLNPVAATVLNGLKEREGSSVSVPDLLADIKRLFDVAEIPDDVLIADIHKTLDSFKENGLIRLE